MSDLEPCPGCGTTDHLFLDFTDMDGYTRNCVRCGWGVIGQGDETQEEIDDIWNTRAAGWITDRDPEEEGSYFVTVRISGDEPFVDRRGWDREYGWHGFVVAWMPLPEPWKGDE